MPIKFGEIDNAQLYVMQDGEYKPLGHISEVELTSEPVNPTPNQEYHAYFSSEPIEFTAKITSNPRAFAIFITTGNDLYLRFPKKTKEKKKNMKTLDFVKEHINEIEQDHFIDQRFTKRFLDFLPIAEWGKYGYEYTGEGEYTPKEWTEANILQQLKSDTEFAIEKATNHRGISASLMNSVLIAWCIVLENGLESTDYGWYGDKLIKKIDELYGFGLVYDDTFDSSFYEEW